MPLAKRKEPNIVLISVDTLRSEHLNCYGYKRNTSPNISKLAIGGVQFLNAFAQSSFTPSSHASIFSSRYVSSFKTDRCGYYFKNGNITSLAEVLKDNGYTTAGFVGGGWIASSRGFNRGFDIYDDNGGGIKLIVEKAFHWLNKNQHKKFFLFLHCYDVHQYRSEENKVSNFKWAANVVPYLWKVNAKRIDLTKGDLSRLTALYDNAISYVDNYIGRLLNKLTDLDLQKKSLIVFFSDHGEAFYEHGLLFHCIKLYDEFIRIPLIMQCPAVLPKDKMIETQIQSIDIMPTILEILNIPNPKGIQGLSLVPLIKKEKRKRIEDRSIFSESFGEDRYLGFLKKHGINFDDEVKMIRTRDWKYIYNFKSKKGELFSLKEDPEERNNLIRQKQKEAQRLKKQLFNQVQKLKPTAVVSRRRFDKSDEALIREKLKSLGYL